MSRYNPRLLFWLRELHEHKELSAVQRDILAHLALFRLDWGTGRGYCAISALAESTGTHEATVKRALKVARTGDPQLLKQTRRGHRISDEASLASEWQIIYPPIPTAPQGDLGPKAHQSDLGPKAHEDDLGTDPTAHGTEANSAPAPVQQRAGALPTENESPSRKTSSLSRAVAEIRTQVPDATEREILEVVQHLEADPDIRNTVAYLITAVRNGDSASLVTEARTRLDKADASNGRSHNDRNGTRARTWCGKCSSERERQIEVDGKVARCPDCHPLRVKAAS